jgi:hypothetical protein
MKRLASYALAFLVMLSLAIPSYAQRDAELRVWDVYIPKEYRNRNVNGNCVWCAAETVFMGAGHEQFGGVFKRAVKEGWAGADLQNVVAYAKRDGVEVVSQRSGGPKILYDAVRNGTGAYIQSQGHAVAVVGIDDDRVVLIDNNPPSYPGVKIWTRRHFDQWWGGTACYPKVNKWTAVSYETKKHLPGYHFIYRGGAYMGYCHEEDSTWHALRYSADGLTRTYVEEPAPWLDGKTKGPFGIFPLRRRNSPGPDCPGPNCPSPGPSPGPSPDAPSPNPNMPKPPAVDPSLPPPWVQPKPPVVVPPIVVPPVVVPPVVSPVIPTADPLLKKQLDDIQNLLKNMKAGPPGKDGKNGVDGKDGADGKNGTDGKSQPPVDLTALTARLAVVEAQINALPQFKVQVLPKGVIPK